MNADRIAYEQLVSTLADQEPSCGWAADDLPDLSTADIALLCRERPDEVVDRIDLTDYIEAVGTGLGCISHLNEALQEACKRAIWHDVLSECESRQIERDRERELRRPESLDARYGVAHLFRESTR